GEIVLVYIDNFASTDNESKYFGKYVYDVVALSRLLNLHTQQKNSVSVLSRTEAPLKDAFPKITKLFKHSNDTKRVRSTTHGYKGLEQSSVILWDVTERQYPMIHPHWIFGRILGDTLEQIIEDERRLFYVGVTRAGETLYIITRRQSMSPFLQDVLKSCKVTELDPNSLPVIDALRSDAMFVRLSGNTFEIKDYFKQHDYKWNAPHKVWEKRVIIDEFTPTQLTEEAWFVHATDVTVTCVDEIDDTVWYKFRVNAGVLIEITV
ncbi:MAG: 3'-5' exonuclease, partial [Roseiflexaceae bacterium]